MHHISSNRSVKNLSVEATEEQKAQLPSTLSLPQITFQLQSSSPPHQSISITRQSSSSNLPDSKNRISVSNASLKILWLLLDNVLLLQMGSAYLIRFHEFALAADGGKDLPSIDDWRKEQQAEWNRLSTTLGLLAAMHAAILAISPQPPNLAYAFWLGGGTLSVCGLFIVQYFPIKAFSMTDEDIGFIVTNGNEIFNTTLLAAAIASPVIICLWAAVLFIAGMIDYIIESDLGGVKYRVFAAIPVGFGIGAVVMTMALGEIIDRRMKQKYYPDGLPHTDRNKAE
ncbi:hypothetical protein CPB83DRAFT_595015 [Crepidotus variabilis]|uniref:Uncharacterized protein n=1 Tax=Crepidotus variabilis TaxID=179855 RepID=A0A9P6JLK5_9AGAR|nr:hypothetical protein CPB83DRAFT_595015 [Crepidotus variabilis]